jgi:bifunctional non-homologous end joining protein LigD
MIFDLDPGEGVAWKAVIEAAHALRDHFEALGLVSFLRTTGGKGLHVVVPLTRRSSWSDVKSFAKELADAMVRTDRDKYIATASKAKRRGKIYIDYLRNERGATAVASYSTRARKGAPVATPIRWDELNADLAPDYYTTSNVPKRLASLASDPWEGFFDVRQSITKAMARQVSQM